MSEHKYNEAYSKGYRDGQKDQCLADAIDDALVMLGKLDVTNGDMIRAMFNVKNDNQMVIEGNVIHVYANEWWLHLDYKDWWNAPYRR